MPDLELPPLVSTEDEAWAQFQANDPNFFMNVASDAIRQYCGWHIWPNLNLTIKNLPIESHGMITLPSMKVTDVQAVIFQDPGNQSNNTVLDSTQYNWFDYGVIEPIGFSNWQSYGGAFYGPDQYSYLPVYQFGLATVVFDSGYEKIPANIQSIAYELVTTTMEVSAGNVKEIQTPGYRLMLSKNYGANMNDDQKDRLSVYRLPSVK